MQASELVGTQLGPYKIQSLLGSGGMASVYRGFDQNLQRPVAIKVLSQEAATQPGFAEQFRQEARMIAGLHHPHIVQVYNFGQQGDYTYMVQELLPGPTLEQYLRTLATRGKRLRRQDIVSIVLQLASALDVAHAAGIVHRDVKPANALWNAASALVLTDFGVARHMLTEARHGSSGRVFGTPYYLSPEQAQGLPGSQASDIYALGVVIYELITGQVPFTGDTQQAIMRQHVEIAPPLMQHLRPDVPATVETVVQRALAKTPEERFVSAGELARAFKQAWPPVQGREEHGALQEPDQATMDIWEDIPIGIAAHTGYPHGSAPANIYFQTTLIAAEKVPDVSATASASVILPEPEEEQHTASQSLRRAWASRPMQGTWQLFTLLLGTLLVLFIVGATIIELQQDYQETVTASSPSDLVAPTAVPTARLALTTAIPTPPSPPPATATPAEETVIAEDDGLIAPTAASDPGAESVALPVRHDTEVMVPNGQFAQLRTLIEADNTEGWARIDRNAWLQRLEDIEQAVEAGDTQQAAIWLDEMRQTLLRSADAGTMEPAVVEQVMTNINSIASNNGIALPPVNSLDEDDG